MLKKRLLVSALIVFFIIIFSYVFVGKININNKMESYLEGKGYRNSQILSIKVKHSFINIPLSYNEWNIWVVYKDEPNATYFYTYKKRMIIPAGIAGVPEGNVYTHGDPEPIKR